MQAALTGEKPELSRGGWPRRWVLIGAGAALALVLLVGIVWFSPLLAARTIEVRGQAAVPEEQIRNLARVPKGQPLLRVDTDAAARRRDGARPRDVRALPPTARAAALVDELRDGMLPQLHRAATAGTSERDLFAGLRHETVEARP